MTLADTAQAEAVVADVAERGVHLFGEVLDPAACAALLADLKAGRDWGAGLFLDEAAFDADPQYRGVNPRPGRNLLEGYEARLKLVEANPAIVAGLTALLGEGYVLMDRKVVCGVPASVIPDWLKARIAGNPVNNLGTFVKPQYRDVTYFYGIDFHQDLIDFKGREADFVTLYIYLAPVTRADAPLFLLEGSHRLGASVFPHDLARDGETWRYRSDGREAATTQRVLTGGTGYAAVWHACTLHGTQPDEADHERISLRYLLARGPAAEAGMDRVNATLLGPLALADTRVDLDAEGAARIKANTVNQA
ncbi:MAG: phytanoyl-CoA dioxygenase family protein [Caulobacter sp.]|nr:phytanoyl-CoA dioxygenase family protein [Caulobacter sp.]